MRHLALSLLGPLQVYLDGRLVAGFESQKVRALLVYLALNADRRHARDTLAGLLWPEQPDLDARNNLRQALANLRQTLGDRAAAEPFLRITRDAVQFNPASDHQIDVVAFTALLDACQRHPHRSADACSSCARRLEQAAELYHGSFLDQFFLSDSAAFEEWVLLTRERLQARAVAALGQLSSYHERRGAYDQAQEYTRRELALESWREESHRALMRQLALGGQRSAALQQYAICRRVLATEFGAEPETATVELYEQIKRGDAPIPRQLPIAPTNLAAHTPPTQFIGRARELVQLADWLEDRNCRLLTLVGPGGVGKTRLALQVATEARESFPDGVWFVDLVPLRDPELLVTTIAQTVGVQEVAGQSLQDSLKHALRSQQILLVLDNFEQIVEAAPVVGALLAAAPGLAVLATSRAPLRLSGEREVAVAPLAVPDPAQARDVALICDNDAVRLFVERAQAVKADFALSDENSAAVAEICLRLDGLPLALELAAARVKLFPPQALLARLEQRLSFLTNGTRDLPPRQRTLRAAISWSYDLLDPGAQMLFSRLGVFVGGCTLEAAEAVCNADGDLAMEMIDGIAALLDQSLLRQEEGPDGAPRFVMLESIHEYALERLVASGEAGVIHHRHAAYYLMVVETAAPKLLGGEQSIWMYRLEQEHDNLRATHKWYQNEEAAVDLEVRLMRAMTTFWYLKGHWSEGRSWSSSLLARTTTAERTVARAWTLTLRGIFSLLQGDHTTARDQLEESIPIWQGLDDKHGYAYALCFEGRTLMSQGEYPAAYARLEQSAALFREEGDRWGLTHALDGLGYLFQFQGEFARAQVFFEEALAICRELNNKLVVARSLNHLARLVRYEGNDTLAHKLSEESLALAREHDIKLFMAQALQTLGDVACDHGNSERAVSCFKEGIALFQAVGDTVGILECLEAVANTVGACGQPTDAVRLFGLAAATRETIGAPLSPIDRIGYDRGVAAAHAMLDEPTFAAAWAEGLAMTLEQAIELALDEEM